MNCPLVPGCCPCAARVSDRARDCALPGVQRPSRRQVHGRGRGGRPGRVVGVAQHWGWRPINRISLRTVSLAPCCHSAVAQFWRSWPSIAPPRVAVFIMPCLAAIPCSLLPLNVGSSLAAAAEEDLCTAAEEAVAVSASFLLSVAATAAPLVAQNWWTSASKGCWQSSTYLSSLPGDQRLLVLCITEVIAASLVCAWKKVPIW